MNADSQAPPGPPAGEEDFARMFAASIEATEEGQVIHGRVIKVLKEYLAVDINKKSEGMLPWRTHRGGEEHPPAGDPIEVMTEGYDQAQGSSASRDRKSSRSASGTICRRHSTRAWRSRGPSSPRSRRLHRRHRREGVPPREPGGPAPGAGQRPGHRHPGKVQDPQVLRKKANVVVSRRTYMEEERDVLRKGFWITSRRGTSSRRG